MFFFMQSLNCICPTKTPRPGKFDITTATFHTRTNKHRTLARRRTNSCFSVSEGKSDDVESILGTVPICGACLYILALQYSSCAPSHFNFSSSCSSYSSASSVSAASLLLLLPLYSCVLQTHSWIFWWIHSNVMLFFWHLYSVSCKNWDSHTDGLLDFHSSLSTTMGRTFCPFIALTCQLRDERK